MNREQILEQIRRNQERIADLRATGTSHMSKQGVRWCVWSHRETIKRLRAYLKELS